MVLEHHAGRAISKADLPITGTFYHNLPVTAIQEVLKMKKNIKTWNECENYIANRINNSEKNNKLAAEIIRGEKRKTTIWCLAFICSLVGLIGTNLWRLKE